MVDLLAVGNALVDRVHRVTILPPPDGGAAILERSRAPGGVEANVAAAAAALGLDAAMVAHVGRDADGEEVLADLRERGIDTDGVRVGEPGDTANSLVFVDPEGRRIIFTGGRGAGALELADADLVRLSGARVCATSAYVPAALLRGLADACARTDTLLSVDLPGTFDDLAPRGITRELVAALLPRISLLVLGRAPLADLTGTEDVDEGLDRLRRHTDTRVAVTAGAEGLHVDGDGERVHAPACPVEVVDTSGAGDVTHAALIAAWLLDGAPPEQAAVAGAAAGGHATLAAGARGALPGRRVLAGAAAQRPTGAEPPGPRTDPADPGRH
ncbi:carbohydrate kinase family protein [Egibacter rhizosphaerae]|uniref:Carbohydrate kinase family protein n=1 Tax=Egibacter rhizosphaerae TaxID=1670831 RepID=A0A411YJB5_9ACTN|nr:carbohydrate kinase family protein [Egibacter rhizosphaerae]QBI21320.1 carbohydrate kinase family protein [Egibacter rhizosphaerae]